MKKVSLESLTPFDRKFFTGKEKFTYVGQGSIGGKAQGLADIKDVLTDLNSRDSSDIQINIPTLTVIATDFFDLFLETLRDEAFALPSLAIAANLLLEGPQLVSCLADHVDQSAQLAVQQVFVVGNDDRAFHAEDFFLGAIGADA